MIDDSRKAAQLVALLIADLLAGAAGTAFAQQNAAGRFTPSNPAPPSAFPSPKDVLSPQQWMLVDRSVQRANQYLLEQQQPDGSFAAPPSGQPGITALCVLALLSSGHLPGEGPCGEQINRGIEFVLLCQRSDGLLSFEEPVPHHIHNGVTHAGNYNHAIAGLMLGEVYGISQNSQQDRIGDAIRAGLDFMRKQQLRRKRSPLDNGGVRYLNDGMRVDADLSATSWQLMFMRSAKNAEFEVPQQYVDDAMAFVRRCFDDRRGAFVYGLVPSEAMVTRGVNGGGIVSLALAGEHESNMARRAGEWVLKQPFAPYNRGGSGPYHYGAYYCSQAMFQLGGRYWQEFYPRLMTTLVENQGPDGAWQREGASNGVYFGQTYTTAITVLALTPAYQLLPIYQR